MPVEPPEDVYIAAATASVRAEGVNDGYIASTARDEPFRAAVRVAYAAGRQAAASPALVIYGNNCCGGNGVEASCDKCRTEGVAP